MSATPEFSRPRRIDTLGGAPTAVTIEADADERAALARRFGLVTLDRLTAELTLVREGETVTVDGRVTASLAQPCIATEQPVLAGIDEAVALRLVPEVVLNGEDERELADGDLDVVGYAGGAIDLGEIAAETMALALDPFPRAPGADAALREAGVVREGEVGSAAFAGLAALKQSLEKRD